MKLVPGQVRSAVHRVVGGDAPPTKQSSDTTPRAPTPPSTADLNLAMIVGAQRSGTTWLQMLCAAHPRIAGGEESHVFGRYLSHLVVTFYEDLAKYAGSGRPQGVPCVLTTAEFDDAIKQFATSVLGKLLRAKPGADLVVEKTPDHVLHLHYIRHLFPAAKVIHVIRDPRDVVVSLRAAGTSWGRDWAPTEVAEAAQRWVDWVNLARAQARPAELYHEIRYESLLSDGPRELSRVYDFLGLPLPAEQVEHIYSQFSLAACKSGQTPRVLVDCGELKPPPDAKAPEGFFRQGKAGGWRESLTAEEAETVERIAAPLLHELGYAPANLAAAAAAAAADT